MSHLDRFQRFGNRTDLVQLDQNGVAAAQFDALLQTFSIGNEQVVANQLYLAAQLCRQLLPAFPVFFVQSVFDRDDRILLYQISPVLNQFVGSKISAGLRLVIEALALFAFPLRRSSVHRDHEIPARLIARCLYRFQNGFNGFVIAGQVRSKAALVADRSCQSLGLQDLRQIVEHFCTPTQGFLKAGSTYRHDHEFLCVYRIGGMSTAVQNVHHRNRQTSAGYAAQKTIQRNVQCSCCGSCCGNGNCQNRIGTQIGLVLGAVCGDHCLVYCVQIRCVHTSDSFVDNGIDVFYSLGHALAQIASLVAVTQFQCFEFAGGSTAGGSTSCNSTVNQCDFCFYSRIASGIQNLSADNFFDLQITHSRILLYVSRKHCTNPAFRLCTQALYRVSFSITHVHFEVSYL